jgi:DNA repair exonuclease SbcCD ATPase subunit/DNA repair exonuclease SbcCD nuclease subunit
MEIKKIETGITKLNKLFHVSDIHIRTLKRHTEYKEVFDRLFSYITDNATENDAVVITGDIVHAKLDMSPELVQLLVYFFSGFNIPTIVILGNHDMNLNNMHRIDAISPILDVINKPNITFIKENGLFEYGGVVFNHMAVDVAPSNYIMADQFDATYKIAMHHGAVNSAKTDIGYTISNENVTTAMFAGHNITLLGDIHKPAQYLNDEKTIAYPGSLIQQNYGEALNHGILVWDIETSSAEFVEIVNDYGYVTFEVNDTTLVKSPTQVPLKPRVRIIFNGTTAADMKKIITMIRSKYQVQDISIQRKSDSVTANTNSSINIGNVRDVEYQNTLITDYIGLTFPMATAEELDAIRHINRTINSKLPVLDSVRHVTWHPVSFKFDNMFSYGENNIINFENINGVNGLFAANTSGKSSLLDAITYTIFDKCSKTGKAHEVLNNKKSHFKGEFSFEMNGIIYTIIREGIKRKDGHVKVNVEFYTESENLNGDERSDTNKNIRKYLGTYDDFILTAFSLQADNNNFIEKSQRERKDLLSQFLDIAVFEQLSALAIDDSKETAGKIKEYKKTDFDIIITESNNIIIDNQESIINFETDEDVLQDNRNTAQNEIVELIESKQPTSYTGPSITELENNETELTNKITKLQNDIELSETKLDKLASDYLVLKKNIRKYNETELKTSVDKLSVYESEIADIQLTVNQQQEIINAKQEKINHLTDHQYDKECKYCTSNIFVQNAIEAQNTIETDYQLLKSYQQEIDTLTEYTNHLTNSLTHYNELQSYKLQHTTKNSEIKTAELQLQILENELQTNESELESTLERQGLFKLNESAIIHNAAVDVKITELKSSIETYNTDIKTTNNLIKSMHGAIEVAKTKKSLAITQLDIYKQLEIEYKAYEYYLKSVSRDGVPYDIISKAIPKIETEINNVLNQVVDFNMVLQTDGKNINGYIIYDEDNFWPLELTSGMERFISSLAIRIALINVSALPRPNFIAIDEGWGSLDQEHISAVVNLFEYFRTKFDFSIIISHVDSMRDMVDNLIEVNKINGFSQIIHF